MDKTRSKKGPTEILILLFENMLASSIVAQIRVYDHHHNGSGRPHDSKLKMIIEVVALILTQNIKSSTLKRRQLKRRQLNLSFLMTMVFF